MEKGGKNMNNLDFPLLVADDIECRVGNVKQGKGFSLLLYKTARTDAKYLDLVVGAFNWQSKYYLLNNTLFCSIGVFNEERQEWIWKDDCGSETQVEAEKGQSSDAFKRAGFRWGIGRSELYSAPFIWVEETEQNTPKKKYQVKSISYDDNKEIKTLEIINEKNEVVFSYGLKQKVAKTSEKAEKTTSENKGEFFDLHANDDKPILKEQLDKILMYVFTLGEERKAKFDTWLLRDFNVKDYNSLTESQAKTIIAKCHIGE